MTSLTLTSRQRRATMLAAATLALGIAGGATVQSAQAITSSEAADLQLMRDEERMARDLYRVISTKYGGLLPFSNIQRSEQRHFDAVGSLLTRYDVADPAVGKTAGVYANAEVQRLYDGWRSTALKSKTYAYRVGIALEKRDIADLTRAINATSDPVTKQVLTNLRSASKKHLAAFTRAANGQTATAAGKAQMGKRGRQGQMQRGAGAGNASCPMNQATT
ncbi:MAG: DUF2202 domain-containing protein [Actinobacteria bacterium]|nr:DUF2202 domain-containing protein [Thermoleophilia bacterium]MCB9011938.1 DUF2202 domain-containing protein [Actinomycetota bacterium]